MTPPDATFIEIASTPSTLLAAARTASTVIVQVMHSGTVIMADFDAPGPEPVVAQATKNSMPDMIENRAILFLFMRPSFFQ
ncbi:MAG: hypothetical protein MUO52_18705 [Desulfobacterales bacterium]|nr:hypothetical protein [Desulfobacterales bacterium]